MSKTIGAFGFGRKTPENKRVKELRGWSIYRSIFHGRELWSAKRHGVSMNHNTYDGLVKMILRKPVKSIPSWREK